MNQLVDSLKPAPTEVTIVPAKLKTGGEILRFWLSTAIVFQLRTLVVWAFLATFFPTLGITWFMVMFGLYAIRHVVPTKHQDTINAIAAQRK